MNKEIGVIAMLTWRYNRFGHVEIWKGEVNPYEVGRESDRYMQIDTDVEVFFENIGVKMNEVHIGDWDTAEDIGYFCE